MGPLYNKPHDPQYYCVKLLTQDASMGHGSNSVSHKHSVSVSAHTYTHKLTHRYKTIAESIREWFNDFVVRILAHARTE